MREDEIRKKIASLPSGGITKKRITNNRNKTFYEYTVYQWRENGKQYSRYLKGDEITKMASLIEERKKLELQIKENKSNFYNYNSIYHTNVFCGDELTGLISGIKGLKKRLIIKELKEYIFNNQSNKVFILYGLRRTGKSTMIKQVISEMNEEQFSKTAYLQIKTLDELAGLYQDLKLLYNNGYRYIFIDEVTLLSDFIEGAAILSDIYVGMGMKIVLSGTDSLGFWISKANSLYDRCYLLHTTFISYQEFETVLGIKGIDEYIKHGGTMSISGNHYNVFETKINTDEYIDSSIAHNIQHSLKCYQDETHFRHLYSLYENNELTSSINRVIEDLNHRFTINLLTKDFKSNDLALSARNLRGENDVLDHIDKDSVTKRLKELLEIKNKQEQIIKIDQNHEYEIKEYLEALDLIYEIPVKTIDSYKQVENRIIFTQPGLRYSQAKSLIESLKDDEIFNIMNVTDRKYVIERILVEIKGRMLEDIVLLETAINNPNKEVFKLLFADGEYDMVVFDEDKVNCKIYEIKYSTNIIDNQYRHLIDEEKNKKTIFKYGEISGRYVIYRGENQIVNNIEYINVEDYLLKLKK